MNEEIIVESIAEVSIIECTYCKETCKRILAGRYPNGKDKKWVNEGGEEFNGRTCPRCHKEKMAINVRLKRYRKQKRNGLGE